VARQEVLCHKWIESEKAGYDILVLNALCWIGPRNTDRLGAKGDTVKAPSRNRPPPVNQAKLAVLDGERSEFARLARASP
jgi:hypothetical protein